MAEMGGVVVLAEHLPARIQQRVADNTSDIGEMIGAVKTSYKPNATIPLLWLIFGSKGLMLCSTHKTRGVWRIIEPEELNAVQLEVGFLESMAVRIILQREDDDIRLELPRSIEREELENLITSASQFSRQ